MRLVRIIFPAISEEIVNLTNVSYNKMYESLDLRVIYDRSAVSYVVLLRGSRNN